MKLPIRQAAALAAALMLPIPAKAAPDPDALLIEGVRAPIQTSYIAEVENIRFGAHGTRAILLRVEHLAPNLTRRSYLAPEPMFGNSVVIEANRLYEFDVHHHRLITSIRNDPNDLSVTQNLALLTKNYRAVLGADDTIAGVRAQSISLLNRHTGEKAMTLWIDEKTHLIVGKDAYHNDGAVAYQMRFETLRYTGDIPRNVFSTATPQGYTKIARATKGGFHGALREAASESPAPELTFKAMEPRFLPDGFQLVSSTYPTIRNVQMLHLLYSDGIRSVSIFENRKNAVASLDGYAPQNVKIGNRVGRIISSGANSLLTWRGDDNITFTLVGNVTEQQLTKIAETLR